MSRLFKQTLLYSIGDIVPKMFAFLLLPVYTRYLLPKDYGMLSYTNSIVMFLFVLSTLSLNSFLIRKFFEINDPVERRKLIGNIFLCISGLNILLFLLAYITFPILILKLNIQVPWSPYFKLALVNNFLEVFSIVPLLLYRIRQNALNYVLLNLVRVIFQIALTYYLIVYEGLGLLGNYYGQLYPLLIFFFIYMFIVYRNAVININLEQLKEGLRFSLPLLPGAISYLALSFSDRIILERNVSLAEMGIYNIAFLLSFSLNIIIQSGYKALEPEIFKRYGTDKFKEFINSSKSVFFFFVYSGAMFITLFSQEIFKIMASDKFYEGYLLVPFIMIGVIMTGQNVIYSGIITAEKKTKVIGFATMLGALVSVLFNLIFIPKYGIYAAALSSALSFSAMNLVLFLKMSFEGKQMKMELLALFIFILSNFLLFYIIDVKFSLTMIICKVLIFITYSGVLVIIFKLTKNVNMFKNGFVNKRI